MSLDRSEIEKELIKRGRIPDPSNNSYSNNNDEIKQELINRGVLSDNNNSNSIVGSNPLQTAGNVADIFNKAFESTGLPALSGGLLQGVAQPLESVANLALSPISKIIGKNVTIPYPNLQKYLPNDPYSNLTFMGGELSSALLPFSQGSKLAESLASNVMDPSIARTALSGAATGFATSGSDNPYSRYYGAAAGGSIPPLLELKSTAIANKVLSEKDALQQEFKQRYGDIFDSLKDKGLDQSKVEIPSIFKSTETIDKIDDIFEGNRDFEKPISEFINNPNFKNSHDAQSELGKLQSKLYSQMQVGTGKPVASAIGDRMASAKNLQQLIRDNMQKFAVDNNIPEIGNAYSNVTKDYSNNMSPYLNPNIAAYNKGNIRSKDLVNSLINNDKFMAPNGAYNDIPGLKTRAVLNNPMMQKMLQAALIGAGGTAGAGLMYKAGLPYLGSLIRQATG